MRRLYPSLFDPNKSVEVWFCDASCCKGKQLHRDDGPAVIHPDGIKEWWQHGKRLTEAEVSSLLGELYAKQIHEGVQNPVKPMRLGRIPRSHISETPEGGSIEKNKRDDK